MFCTIVFVTFSHFDFPRFEVSLHFLTLLLIILIFYIFYIFFSIFEILTVLFRTWSAIFYADNYNYNLTSFLDTFHPLFMLCV